MPEDWTFTWRDKEVPQPWATVGCVLLLVVIAASWGIWLPIDMVIMKPSGLKGFLRPSSTPGKLALTFTKEAFERRDE